MKRVYDGKTVIKSFARKVQIQTKM